MHTSFTPAAPDVSPLADGLTSTLFTPAVDDAGAADTQSAAYVRAVEWGFYETWLTDEVVNRRTRSHRDDGRQHLGVYVDPAFADQQPWGATYHAIGFSADYPVGTFVHYDKTVNAGGPEPLPARLISDVTVNPGFRRRGILKHMMTRSLAQAVSDGLPMAALTVSEGGIYGRFGFGMATRSAAIEVNVGAHAGSALHLHGDPVGKVITVDPSRAEAAVTDLWDRFHAQQRGSVGRQRAYWKFGTAQWNPEDISSWNRGARVAAYIRPDGSVGGMVWFRHLGWDSQPTTVEVKDFLALDGTSHAELWRFLASLDLVGQVKFSRAPLADPLLHRALNPHSYRVTAVNEHLWLRILDPVRSLEARQWGADGEFSLTVTDDLGIASGTFTVSVSGGVAQVASVGETGGLPLHVTMDATALASWYLGDVSVQTLRDAGRVHAEQGTDWPAISATADLPSAPYCATHF